jgi:alkylated DNA repair dioxygenase AlkB
VKPEYKDDFAEDPHALYVTLEKDLEWISTDAPRKEYFMSINPTSYTYGVGRGERTYESKPFNEYTMQIMNDLNEVYGCDYNVCFFNYYLTKKDWLGWHSDDSPSMDSDHPIAVISLGVERDINWRPIGHKGQIPAEWVQRLKSGSLFIMPAGFQELFQHKIPKHCSDCSGRISLTFRRYKENDK